METKLKKPPMYKINLSTSLPDMLYKSVKVPFKINGIYTRDVAETKVEQLIGKLPEGVTANMEMV